MQLIQCVRLSRPSCRRDGQLDSVRAARNEKTPRVHPISHRKPACRFIGPRVNDCYFVPEWMWPEDVAKDLTHGRGWLITVQRVTSTKVKFHFDDDAELMELKRKSFCEHCRFVVNNNTLQGLFDSIDTDTLHVIFAKCNMTDLLSFEQVDRAALIAVRDYLQTPNSWEHEEIQPGVTGDALSLAASGSLMVVGGGRNNIADWRMAGPHSENCWGSFRIYHRGIEVFTRSTLRNVRIVAVDASTQQVAVALPNVQLFRIKDDNSIELRNLAADHLLFYPGATALAFFRGVLYAGKQNGLLMKYVERPGTLTPDVAYSRNVQTAVTALAATKNVLVTAYADGCVKRVRPDVVQLRGVGASTRILAMHGDAASDTLVAATRLETSVEIWKGTARIALLHCAGKPSALHMSAVGLWVGIGHKKPRIELWKPQAKRRVGMLDGFTDGMLTGLAMDHDGRLVSASVTKKPNVGALWRSRAPVALS